MKIYAINDTSGQHAGCKATMKAFYDLLSDHEIVHKYYSGTRKHGVERIIDCDAVVCNGEGTMHHDGRNMKFLMNILGEAQSLKKKTLLINSLWDSNSEYEELKNLDFLAFRDVLSQKAAGMGEVYSDLVFNNTYDVPPKTGKDLIFTDNNFPLEGDFQELINKMADCKEFVTDRYHGVVLAMITNTPFVAVKRNTHKIEGLLGTDAPLLTKEIINGVLNET